MTNRHQDGSIGVPEDIRNLLAGCDDLYHPYEPGFLSGALEDTMCWINVHFDENGAFAGRVN